MRVKSIYRYQFLNLVKHRVLCAMGEKTKTATFTGPYENMPIQIY